MCHCVLYESVCVCVCVGGGGYRAIHICMQLRFMFINQL